MTPINGLIRDSHVKQSFKFITGRAGRPQPDLKLYKPPFSGQTFNLLSFHQADHDKQAESILNIPELSRKQTTSTLIQQHDWRGSLPQSSAIRNERSAPSPPLSLQLDILSKSPPPCFVTETTSRVDTAQPDADIPKRPVNVGLSTCLVLPITIPTRLRIGVLAVARTPVARIPVAKMLVDRIMEDRTRGARLEEAELEEADVNQCGQI